MSWMDGARARLRLLFSRGAAESRMDEEIRLHIELETEKNIRAGMSPAEARRRAVVSFGGVESHKEEMREGRQLPVLEDVWRDLRYAARSLAKAPAFTAAAALTIGLGIGASTAMFNVVDALFLRAPAGVDRPDEVVRLYIARDEGMIQNPQGGAGSFVDYAAIREEVPGFAESAAFLSAREMDLNRGADAQRIRGAVVSQGFLPLLGVEAQRGRLFLPEEDSVIGAHPVAVISDGFWRGHFGADPEILGRTLLLNGQTLTIVGVAEPGFTGIEADPVDVWVPMAMASPLGIVGGSASEDWRHQPAMIMVSVLGRLAPGADPEAVAAAATLALEHTAESAPGLDPTPRVLTGTLVPAGGPNRSLAAELAVWLMVVTGIVLAIACANVANLLLSRGATRRRETAIRLSIGAGRWRLLRQHLTESFVIAAAGGVLGILIALWSSRIISQFPLPPSSTELSARPLLFAIFLVFATALLFGLAPGLQAMRSDAVKGLKDGKGSTGPAGMRTRRLLIGVQVSLSVVLLVGAILFVRSLQAVLAIDPGLDTDRLLLVSTDLRQAGYAEGERETFYEAARERALGMPGVESAVMVHFAPLAGMAYGMGFEVPGRETPVMESGPYVNWVAPHYFATVGTDLLMGREIMPEDATGEPVAVVNEAFARALDPAGDPLGMCIALGGQTGTGACTRVVGVVQDQMRPAMTEPRPMVFLPRERNPEPISWGGPTLVVRTRGDASEVAGEVRSALQALDPRLPFVSAEPLSSMIAPELLPYRLGATLFGLFGILALVLAAVGLYGILGFFIAERRPEIGIRRSLGAREHHLVRFVLREGMLPVVAGLLIGLGGAFAGVTVLEALLFGVGARDPLSFGAASGFLFTVALIACLVPARRATRVDPMVALRAE